LWYPEKEQKLSIAWINSQRVASVQLGFNGRILPLIVDFILHWACL